MAKYSITYSCGHTADKQLYGPVEKRQQYVAWAAQSGRCPACGSADDAQELAEFEAANGLPELSGSPKQIKWGREIRAERTKDVITFVEKNRPATMSEEQTVKFDQQYAAVLQYLGEQTTAAWWIDRRTLSGQEIARLAFAAIRR